MNNYLVDVNLPKYFRFFNRPNFQFVSDIDLRLSDTDIWQYAIENHLIILTKDTDFYHRSLAANQKPKIVFFKLGNTTLSQLNQYFEQNWLIIEEALSKHDLIIALPNRIDALL